MISTASVGLVDHRLRGEWINGAITDEVSLDVVHAHGTHVGHVDAGDAVLVDEQLVAGVIGDRQAAELLGGVAHLVDAVVDAVVVRGIGDTRGATEHDEYPYWGEEFTQHVHRRRRSTG